MSLNASKKYIDELDKIWFKATKKPDKKNIKKLNTSQKNPKV